MSKLIIATLLTLFLGPGAGHLYLRKFLKGCAFIGASLLIIVHLAWELIRAIPNPESIDPNAARQFFAQHFIDFSQSHPDIILLHNALIAALWAYALIDVYLIARKEMPAENAEEDEPGP